MLAVSGFNQPMKTSIFWLVVAGAALLFAGQGIVRADDPNVSPKWAKDYYIAYSYYSRGMSQLATDTKAAEESLYSAQRYAGIAESEGAGKAAMEMDHAISRVLAAIETAQYAPKRAPVAAPAPSAKRQPAIVRGRSALAVAR